MTAADTAALIAEARDWARQLDTSVHFIHPGARLVYRLVDALEQAESEIRADQMRRDAGLLDAEAAELAERIPMNSAYYADRALAFHAAADRLRSGQPAGGQ